MKTPEISTSVSPITRRTFLKTGTVLTTALTSLSLPARAQINKNGKLRIFHIGVGGVAAMRRKGLQGHPMVEFAGFCDVDRRVLDKITKEHPCAWTVPQSVRRVAGSFGAGWCFPTTSKVRREVMDAGVQNNFRNAGADLTALSTVVYAA